MGGLLRAGLGLGDSCLLGPRAVGTGPKRLLDLNLVLCDPEHALGLSVLKGLPWSVSEQGRHGESGALSTIAAAILGKERPQNSKCWFLKGWGL